MVKIHRFGGEWTLAKLECLEKYLQAYVLVMKNQPFRTIYIDAFAGTGSIQPRNMGEDSVGEELFADLADSQVVGFLKGSASVALSVVPPFSRYVFVDKSKRRVHDLGQLGRDFPTLSNRIEVFRGEANEFLLKECAGFGHSDRAVVFLDPYGMQARWETIKALAATKVVDLWVLFPLGVGVNRLLRKDGRIPDSWRNRLNETFGDSEMGAGFLFNIRGSGPVRMSGEEREDSDLGFGGRILPEQVEEGFSRRGAQPTATEELERKPPVPSLFRRLQSQGSQACDQDRQPYSGDGSVAWR